MKTSWIRRLAFALCCFTFSTHAASTLYWTQRPCTGASFICKSDLAITNIVHVLGGTDPLSLSLDAAGGKFYWGHNGWPSVRRANLDGTVPQILITGMTWGVLAMDVDSAAGKVYYADGTKLYRANLDGTANQFLTNSPANKNGLAVDPINGKLYWTEGIYNRISRSNLDGSGTQQIITNGLNYPFGIDVDVSGGKIYWTDRGSYRLMRANLDGTGVQVLLTNVVNWLDDVGLDVPAGKVYWSSYYQGFIKRANLDGTAPETVITGQQCISSIDLIPGKPCEYFQGRYAEFSDIPANIRGVETADGGYAIASGARLVGATDNSVYLLKSDIQGAPQWVRRYGGAGDDAANYVCESETTNLVMAGRTDSFGAGGQDFYVLKSDSMGSLIWSSTYGTPEDEFANHILHTGDKGYLLSGTRLKPGGNRDVYLVKIRNSGILQWACSYDVDKYDIAYSAIEVKGPVGGPNPGPHYIITGSSGPYQVGTDVLLFRIDANGNPLWANTYGGGGPDVGFSLMAYSNGVLIAGVDDSFDMGQGDGLLLQTTLNGVFQWWKSYGWTGAEQFRSVVKAPDGGIAVGGFSIFTNQVAPSPYRFWLVKTSGGGAFQWSRIYGDGLNESLAFSLDNAANGGYYLAGPIRNGSSSFFSKDFYAVRADSFGLVQFEGPYDPTCYLPVNPAVKQTDIFPAGRHIIPKFQGVRVIPNTGSFNETLNEQISCVGCTPCPLDAAWKTTGTPAQPGFYWARDNVLQGNKVGDNLISDFYATAGAVSAVVADNFELAASLARFTVEANAVAESYEANPGKPLTVQSSLIQEGVDLAGAFLAALDPGSVKLLQPWVDWLEADPVSLFAAIGVDVIITEK